MLLLLGVEDLLSREVTMVAVEPHHLLVLSPPLVVEEEGIGLEEPV
jgi:hypothetical protein